MNCKKNYQSVDKIRDVLGTYGQIEGALPDVKFCANIGAIRFENIEFRKNTRIEKFGDAIRRIEFYNCIRHNDNLLPSSSVSTLQRLAKIYPNVTTLEFEYDKFVHLKNLDRFNNLYSLVLKNVSIFTWWDLKNTEQMKHITIESTPLRERAILGISKMKNLETLELSEVYTQKNAYAVIIKLIHQKEKNPFPHLETLKISRMPIKKEPEWIKKLTTLTSLNLSGLEISELNTHIITELKLLEELNLDHNPIKNLPTSKSQGLKRLSLLDTNIVKLPDIRTLVSLNCAHCVNIDWGAKKEIFSFANLKHLDVSHTHITELPSWLTGVDPNRERISNSNLEYLDISHTRIKKLPSWLKQTELKFVDISDTDISDISSLNHDSLECLIAENLVLDDFPKGILADETWYLKDQEYNLNKTKVEYLQSGFLPLKQQFEKEEHTLNHVAFLRNTITKKLSPHFFTGGYLETRNEFWEYSHDDEYHQATLVFLGAKGQKDKAISKLLDITDDDFTKCGGQTIITTNTRLYVSDPSMIHDSTGKPAKDKASRKPLANDTMLNILTLSQHSHYRCGHSIFMPENALYVVLISPEEVLEIQRNADFWYRYIRYTVKYSHIMFMLLKEPDNSESVINLEKFKTDSHCHVHREIICLSSDREKDDEEYEVLDKARATLTHAIQMLPSYTARTINGWKPTLRHTKEYLSVHSSISYKAFGELCVKYIGIDKRSSKIHEILRFLLMEAGVCYNDGKKTLYSRAWFAAFLSATLTYAKSLYGEIEVKGLYEYLLDNVMDFDYSLQEIKTLMKELSDGDIEILTSSRKKAKKPYMCICEADGKYLFPQFAYVYEPPLLYEKPNSDIKMVREKWHEKWQDISTSLRTGKYTNKYFIDMPMLSDALFTDIICRIERKLVAGRPCGKCAKCNEGKMCDKCKDKVNADGIRSAIEKDVTIGADGLYAIMPESERYNIPRCCLIVDAVPAFPGCIQFFVGLHPKDEKELVSFDKSGLRKRLSEICDYAFEALLESMSNNNKLAYSMRAYLMLPNNNLRTPNDPMEWRIALRDIYFAQAVNRSNFIFRDWLLPMNVLAEMLPSSVKRVLGELNNL